MTEKRLRGLESRNQDTRLQDDIVATHTQGQLSSSWEVSINSGDSDEVSLEKGLVLTLIFISILSFDLTHIRSRPVFTSESPALLYTVISLGLCAFSEDLWMGARDPCVLCPLLTKLLPRPSHGWGRWGPGLRLALSTG